MILTHPPFSIAPLAVAPLLTSPLLPLFLSFLAPGRCYRTWVLTIYQFFYLSISLSPAYHPNERPPSFNFQKTRWDGFASYFDSHCPSAEEYSSLSLSFAAALFTSLAMNAAKSSIPFGRIKRPPKSWWSAEVDSAVSERRKAFAAAHRSDEDRQAYISASRRASSVIAKAKAEAWQTTCSSLSPRSNPKSVHSLLRSIAGSPSSSSSSPNFPNCSSPRESASVYAAYLRSHFSFSQPKALPSRARGYLTELHRATCSEESHTSFCSPFTPAEFHAAASNLSSSTAIGPDKAAYPMLKHLPRSGMDFLLHIFNLSWFSHFFPSIWKTSSIIPIHKMGKPLDSPASFRPISLTSCVSKLFERIILSGLLFLLESNFILSHRQAGFRPGRSTLDRILFFSQSISDGFNKPGPGSRTILSTIDFSKAFDSVWHPALFHQLISAGFLPCFVRWTQSFFSDRRACVVYQNHKSGCSRIRRGVPQGSVLGPVLFSLCSLMIFRPNVVVRSPAPFGLGQNGCWPSRGSQLPQALSFFFSLCYPLNDHRKAAHSFFKIGRLCSLFLFSCPSLALLRLLILLLLLMSGNVHSNPGPIFSCSVCAGNVTWRGKSVQCSTCSKWVHLSCSKLFLSKFRALGSTHFWSCPSAVTL